MYDVETPQQHPQLSPPKNAAHSEEEVDVCILRESCFLMRRRLTKKKQISSGGILVKFLPYVNANSQNKTFRVEKYGTVSFWLGHQLINAD